MGETDAKAWRQQFDLWTESVAVQMKRALDAWERIRGQGTLYRRTRDGATAWDSDAGVLYTLHTDEHGEPWELVIRMPVERIDAPVNAARVGADLRAMVEQQTPPVEARPNTAEVAAMLREGIERRQIAARYGRPARTVDHWIRQARAEHPDVPQAKRGRAAQQTSEPVGSGNGAAAPHTGKETTR